MYPFAARDKMQSFVASGKDPGVHRSGRNNANTAFAHRACAADCGCVSAVGLFHGVGLLSLGDTYAGSSDRADSLFHRVSVEPAFGAKSAKRLC